MFFRRPRAAVRLTGEFEAVCLINLPTLAEVCFLPCFLPLPATRCIKYADV